MLELACHLIWIRLLHQVGSYEKICVMSLWLIITFVPTDSTYSSACFEENLSFRPNDINVIKLYQKEERNETLSIFSCLVAVLDRCCVLQDTKLTPYTVGIVPGKGLLCLAKNGEDNFINTGFDNGKKPIERFSQPSQCNVYKEAVLKIDQLKVIP